MRLRKGLKRKGMLCILFLSSCQTATKSPWEHREIKSTDSHYCSEQIIRHPNFNGSGIGLEITKSSGQQNVYLNLHSVPLSDQEPTLITIKTALSSKTFELCPLEGGQRLLLPKEQAIWLLTQLREGLNIEVSTGRYTETVDANGFKELISIDQELIDKAFLNS